MSKQLNPDYMKKGKQQARGDYKTERRFRFQNFAERVAAVNLDVHHRLTADDMAEWRAQGDEATPFALDTLTRWVDLNCTAQFVQFRAELEPQLLSVPLILHRRRQIFELIRGESCEPQPC